MNWDNLLICRKLKKNLNGILQMFLNARLFRDHTNERFMKISFEKRLDIPIVQALAVLLAAVVIMTIGWLM